jgi:hypothetical protein
MSAFPNFSNIAPYVTNELEARKGNISKISKMNAWVRIASAAGAGCQIISNPNFKLFGDGASIYGTNTMSGTIGLTWGGKTAVNAENEVMGFRPKPNITSIEVDEGAGNISRKASFAITCYTKGQLDVVCQYFLEPGFSIFLEWGWNTPSGILPFNSALDAKTVSSFQKFSNVNSKREASAGQYDNYLGFITGGSVELNGDTWVVNVKCTGFTELPAYFMVSDNVEAQDTEQKDKGQAFESTEIEAETDLGKKRFMMAFNRLPTNRQSLQVKQLLNDAETANPLNFINFDETVKATINDSSDGWGFLGFTFGASKAKTDGGKTEVPEGTKLIGDYAYIKFGTLVKIINQIGMNGFKLANGDIITIKINTENTVCSAFKKIFSTDKNKLFIPNEFSPKFSLLKASKSETEIDDFTETVNNSVAHTDGTTIRFPNNAALANGKTTRNGKSVTVQSRPSNSFIGLKKPEYQYGFLDDLYVNIDFVKPIIETKNFSMRDALYQILNGISGAAGGMWDFNIIENENGSELIVVELNMTAENSGQPFEFRLIGTDSIFIDASLDLDISGAKMNQVIGNKLGAKINGSQAELNGTTKGLFTNKVDMVLTAIELNKIKTDTTGDGGKKLTDAEKSEAAKKAKEKNLEIFLGKVGYAPKIDKTENSSFNEDLEVMNYICAYNDQLIFQSLKMGFDKDLKTKGGVSPLMPIKFTGTIHGISGIKRGDKFRVRGLPKAYEDSGFFQVTAVKQSIEGMSWKTTIEGGFRKELDK